MSDVRRHPASACAGATLGDDTVVRAFVSIEPHVLVGERCRVDEGARIGTPGFGYALDEDGRWHEKPQRCGVVIGDDVHIGANTCIDRGSYRDTVIGDRSKIDNLVHIAHNSRIGADCLIIAGAVICGSVDLGDGCYVGPGAVIRDHVTVGAGSLVAMGAVVTKDVPAGVTVVGSPARVTGPSKIREIAVPFAELVST